MIVTFFYQILDPLRLFCVWMYVIGDNPSHLKLHLPHYTRHMRTPTGRRSASEEDLRHARKRQASTAERDQACRKVLTTSRSEGDMLADGAAAQTCSHLPIPTAAASSSTPVSPPPSTTAAASSSTPVSPPPSSAPSATQDAPGVDSPRRRPSLPGYDLDTIHVNIRQRQVPRWPRVQKEQSPWPPT